MEQQDGKARDKAPGKAGMEGERKGAGKEEEETAVGSVPTANVSKV